MATSNANRTARRIALVAALSAIATPVSITAISTAATAAPSTTVTTTTTSTKDADYDFVTHVVNRGEQDAVDACAGGVTYMPSVAKYVHKPYYPIHNYCGGTPILSLDEGDLVLIDGVEYQVVDSLDVKRGDNATVIMDIDGDALLQTCYPNSSAMRVVGIEAVA